jgi:hypothetical protein
LKIKSRLESGGNFLAEVRQTLLMKLKEVRNILRRNLAEAKLSLRSKNNSFAPRFEAVSS